MIRKFFAGFIVFLIVILAVPMISVYGVYKTFLNEDFYKGEFLDVVYELWMEAIPDDVEWEEDFGDLEREDFIEVLRDTYSKDDLLPIVESLEEQVKTVKFTEEGILTFEIPFSWLRDKSDLLAESVADMIADSLESCETAEDFDISEHNCIPEGVLVSTVKDGIRLDLEKAILEDIPEVYTFDVDAPVGAKAGESLSTYFGSTINNIFVVGTFVLVILLLILMLIVYRPPSKLLKWVSKAVFLASFIPLVAYIVLFFFAEKLDFGETMAAFDLIALSIKSLSKSIISFLIPIAVFSLIFWILGGVLSKKNEPKRTL